MSFVTLTNTQLVRRDLIRRVSLDENESKVEVELDTDYGSQTVSVTFDTLKDAQESFDSISMFVNLDKLTVSFVGNFVTSDTIFSIE
jgi:hypothetical protein